ncbi:hypothetical protein SNE40_005479 [Patella caerulea]|uniref:G-protein coupled receptors family 1 profile domain-containing protein n=1 Tax=Patella caerulea TaxID=87958 RepID=A0AAN8PWG6_PATCE
MSLEGGEIFFIALMAAVLTFSIISNIFVIIIMVKTPKLRNITNLFICNLSVGDIILAGFVLPQNLHDISHTDDYFEGDFLCRVVNFAPILCITSSIYTLVAIAFERRRALVLQLEPTKPIPVIAKTLPTIWILSFVLCIPTIFEYKSYEFLEGNVTRYACGRLDDDFPIIYSVMNGFMIFFLSYAIPLVLILYNYSKIFVYFWKGRKQTLNQWQANDARKAAQKKHRIQIIKMLILVASFFALAWLPYFVVLIISKMSGADDSEGYSGPMNMFRITLSTFSCAYNVILYAIYNRNFREAFLVTFKCFRRSNVAPAGRHAQTVDKSNRLEVGDISKYTCSSNVNSGHSSSSERINIGSKQIEPAGGSRK